MQARLTPRFVNSPFEFVRHSMEAFRQNIFMTATDCVNVHYASFHGSFFSFSTQLRCVSIVLCGWRVCSARCSLLYRKVAHKHSYTKTHSVILIYFLLFAVGCFLLHVWWSFSWFFYIFFASIKVQTKKQFTCSASTGKRDTKANAEEWEKTQCAEIARTFPNVEIESHISRSVSCFYPWVATREFIHLYCCCCCFHFTYCRKYSCGTLLSTVLIVQQIFNAVYQNRKKKTHNAR